MNERTLGFVPMLAVADVCESGLVQYCRQCLAGLFPDLAQSAGFRFRAAALVVSGEAHAAHRRKGPIHRPHDRAQGNVPGPLPQEVASARSLAALDEPAQLEGEENLLQKLERDVLP